MKHNHCKYKENHNNPSLAKRGFGKLILFLMLLIASFPGSMKAEELFAPLSEMKNVESTYVSGRFSRNIPTWVSHIGGRSVDLSKGFSSLYSYQCYTKESVDTAKKILEDYLKKNRDVELMMRTRQAGGDYMFYEKFDNEGYVEQMIIWNLSGENMAEIVVIEWKGHNKIKPKRDETGKDQSYHPISPQLNEVLMRLGTLFSGFQIYCL